MRAAMFVTLAAAGLAACASTPRPSGPSRPPVAPTAPAASFSMRPVSFAEVPGWSSLDAAPALAAFVAQCQAWSARDPIAPVSPIARYGGAIGAWRRACAAAPFVQAGGERAFFEAFFSPALVESDGQARLTAYYEPIIEARRTPMAPFTEPLLRPPPAGTNGADPAAPIGPGNWFGAASVSPPRSAIVEQPGQAIGYAHPADVYNLQVQGSGRLRFEDGVEVRAAYGGNNGNPWRSALSALRDAGEIANPSWREFRAWIDANPGRAREALNADPSYVYFQEQALVFGAIQGPRGAANVPLTAQGSAAIDPAYHPYGALLFLDSVYDGAPFRRLVVAQDTGGAIRRGPLRADFFFGSGAEAGQAAERMNAPLRVWTLTPRDGGAGTPVS